MGNENQHRGRGRRRVQRVPRRRQRPPPQPQGPPRVSPTPEGPRPSLTSRGQVTLVVTTVIQDPGHTQRQWVSSLAEFLSVLLLPQVCWTALPAAVQAGPSAD